MHYANGHYIHLFGICILNDVYFFSVMKMPLYFLSKYFKITYFCIFKNPKILSVRRITYWSHLGTIGTNKIPPLVEKPPRSVALVKLDRVNNSGKGTVGERTEVLDPRYSGLRLTRKS